MSETYVPESRWRLAIAALLVGGGLLLGGVVMARGLFGGGSEGASKGTDVSRVAFCDAEGNHRTLAEFRGKVILVDVWATWCPPCKLEMPELQAYYAAHAKEGFVVLAIESGEPTDQVASYVQEYGLTFPVFLDPHITALEAFDNWNLPNSYIIDRQGVVRLSWTGGINQPTLEHYVTPLLEENK